MPHFSFRGTEDPACMRCLVTSTRTTVGWVKKVASGYGYRTSETQSWTYGPKRRSEAAEALYAIAFPVNA